MKNAYHTYAQQAVHTQHEKKAHLLRERAELYGVDFLRNPDLLKAITEDQSFVLDEASLKKIATLWGWVHDVQEKAQMS